MVTVVASGLPHTSHTNMIACTITPPSIRKTKVYRELSNSGGTAALLTIRVIVTPVELLVERSRFTTLHHRVGA
jgi:hypothetical protein